MVVAHRRHKKILKQAKGYYGARSRIFRVAAKALLLRLASMHTVTAARASVSFAPQDHPYQRPVPRANGLSFHSRLTSMARKRQISA